MGGRLGDEMDIQCGRGVEFAQVKSFQHISTLPVALFFLDKPKNMVFNFRKKVQIYENKGSKYL